MENSKWIWLNSTLYSEYINNKQNAKFCMAEFKRVINTASPARVKISADSRYMLFVNNKLIGRGPVSAGSDFLFGEVDTIYYDEYEISDTGKLEFKVIVTNIPTVLTENAFGKAGFTLQLIENGRVVMQSDEDWDARFLTERQDILYTDYTRKAHKSINAEAFKINKCIEKSPLEKLYSEKIESSNFKKTTVKAGEKCTLCLNFDKIYSAYPCISIKANAKTEIKLHTSECYGNIGYVCETIITDKDVVHFSPRLRSVGEMKIEVITHKEATIEECYLDFTHYPIKNQAKFKCSDPLLNRIYNVCMHTQKICRQGIHLDSVTHQEHLACTGDYYIQALIEYLNIYDPTLTAFDIYRTSKILECQNGKMFHTTYSLIYPIWLYDYYMFTGDKALIYKCEKSIELLLSAFDGYMSSENGLLEYAPNYMFVDWVVASESADKFIDGSTMMAHGKMKGYSLHHPPKALGQSVLCMLYYEALNKIASLYNVIGKEESADKCLKKAQNIKKIINACLYDSERGLYFGGLNTPDQVPNDEWLPKNISNKYYLKQANVLSVLYDIAPKEKHRDILEYVIRDLNKFEMQPYFYHFLLEALYKAGLFEKHGINLIKKYESILNKCDKGLCEAWENMQCDFSHAWGATPAYILKKALSGFEIIEAGYKKIKLKPNLYGLKFADFDISTPYGKIEISLKNVGEVSVKCPKEIEIVE
ncbi:MAG: hypothetical protein J6K52_05465 [Clostridia bacterium]|nr:hypothetical protein [Clostridia bacterium]MBP3495640.1 hypothetical protein [Clostridia bacterium]